MTELRAPLQAQLVAWQVAPGQNVNAGDVVVILEAMKMEHEVRATAAGEVRELLFAAGDVVNEGDLLAVLGASTGAKSDDMAAAAKQVASGSIRPDLQRVLDRQAF